MNLDEAQFCSSKNSLKLDYESYLIQLCFKFFYIFVEEAITYHLKIKIKKIFTQLRDISIRKVFRIENLISRKAS